MTTADPATRTAKAGETEVSGRLVGVAGDEHRAVSGAVDYQDRGVAVRAARQRRCPL